jgi:hypothetical protein
MMWKLNLQLKSNGKQPRVNSGREVPQGSQEKRVFLFPSRISVPLFASVLDRRK